MIRIFSKLFSTTALIVSFSILLSPNVSLGQSIAAAMGKAEYTRSCASCHGPDGAGNGPMANQLTKPPANLRVLGDKYSSAELHEIIDGRKTIRAHGTSDMPVWGDVYADTVKTYKGKWTQPIPAKEQAIAGRILSLIYYIQSIQAE